MNKRMAEKKRMKALQWSSQRPDLNLTDMLRWKLKRADDIIQKYFRLLLLKVVL